MDLQSTVNATTGYKFQGECYKCGLIGHIAAFCRNPRDSYRDRDRNHDRDRERDRERDRQLDHERDRDRSRERDRDRSRSRDRSEDRTQDQSHYKPSDSYQKKRNSEVPTSTANTTSEVAEVKIKGNHPTVASILRDPPERAQLREDEKERNKREKDKVRFKEY